MLSTSIAVFLYLHDMKSTPETIKESLFSVAQMSGFNFFGIARAGDSSYGNEFKKWVSRGYAADMEWLCRDMERRANPLRILPEARSVIVLGMSYYSQPQHTESEGRGKFARYAWGRDYHEIIADKLADLDELLQLYGGTQRCYVDTGPVMEREWAVEAGLGWQGKSGLFIHPRYGSMTFLSVILSSLELPADTPLQSRCGFCQRCMNACPAKAIVSDGTVDARRCISYQLIENKGSIPVEIRRTIGSRIYGCDACLDACPWNKRAIPTGETGFLMRKNSINLPLTDYLKWTEETFQTQFRHSPVKRVKWRGFIRNVCIAIGNIGSKEVLPFLLPLCRHEDELIREHALWAVGEIEARDASHMA